MTVAIVIPMSWDEGWLTMDPTLLVEGFVAQDEEAVIYCEPGSSYNTDAPVVELTKDQMRSSRTWVTLGVELALVFTWMTNYNDVLRALRTAGVFVISKGDTDGLLVPRVHPGATLQRMMLAPVGSLGKARNAWFWAKRWTYIYRRELELIVENIETADVTAVELEGARVNLHRVLAYAGRVDLSDRIVCIENPVPTSFGAGSSGPRDRVVVSVGRWDDPQKNARLLGRVVTEYGKEDSETRFVLMGNASGTVCGTAPQVTPLGRVGRDVLGTWLSAARVCLITSRWESFHIAGHEALASGCTIVGTPIDAVRSMVGDGSWGTVAAGEKPKDLVRALAEEMTLWDSGKRDPVTTSTHWQRKLRPEAIAERYLALPAMSSL